MVLSEVGYISIAITILGICCIWPNLSRWQASTSYQGVLGCMTLKPEDCERILITVLAMLPPTVICAPQ